MTLFELHQDGCGIREISRISGLSRNTVRRYVRDGLHRNEAATRFRPSKLDPFKEEVKKFVEDGLYSAPAILERLIKSGYQGKETILRDYIRSIKPPTLKAPSQRYETKPGEQLQFDWGMFPYEDDDGKLKKIAGLVAKLGYSRRVFVKFSDSMDIYGLMECLLSAFFHFGGMTNAVLTDHMKTVVIGGDENNGWIYNQKFLDLAKYLGISIKLCQVRRPETKGKVERAIRYVKENFWPGVRFTSLDDLNSQVLIWCKERDYIESRTTGLKPIDAFSKEAPLLKELPNRDEVNKFFLRERKVTHDGFVSVFGASYELPSRFARSTVRVLPITGTLKAFDINGELVATHDLVFKSRRSVFLGSDQRAKLPPPRTIHHTKAFKIPDVEVEERSLMTYEVV